MQYQAAVQHSVLLNATMFCGAHTTSPATILNKIYELVYT